MGAGIGAATAFLYSGPAINVLAIVFTAKILGFELGLARAITAVVMSIVLGLLMARLFRGEQQERAAEMADVPTPAASRSPWQTPLIFASMIAILVFANWANAHQTEGFFAAVFALKWWLTAIAATAFVGMEWRWIDLPGKRLLLTSVAVGPVTRAVAQSVFGPSSTSTSVGASRMRSVQASSSAVLPARTRAVT
ncbi:MAG: hypothetical protein ACI9SE_000484 [Neolewinella sp.]|jgi:hypothetical protein